MSLEDVERFAVTTKIVTETELVLRKVGRDGYECFALWTGVILDDGFSVEHVYVPPQHSYRDDDGLCVRVESDELHDLNRWLYEQRQVLGVQIHTHPREAYHSDTDDTFPIVTTLGGLSIVAPHFCRDGLFSEGTACYRLDSAGWTEVDGAVVHRLIQVH